MQKYFLNVFNNKDRAKRSSEKNHVDFELVGVHGYYFLGVDGKCGILTCPIYTYVFERERSCRGKAQVIADAGMDIKARMMEVRAK